MRVLIRLSIGLFAWAAVFSLLYGLHGIGCSVGWAAVPVAGTSLHRVVLIGAWLAGIAATVALALAIGRGDARDEQDGGALVARGARILAWVAVAATVVGGLPILMIPDCL